MLLVIEDDPMLGAALSEGLSEHFPVDLVATLADARLALETTDYDLAILDLSLPDGSGLELLRELRRAGKAMAVIVLTARDRPQDKAAGLREGADDYMGKPFDLDELVARCEAALRRLRGHAAPIVRIGPLAYDRAGQSVTVDGVAVVLSATDLRVLDVLVANRGRIVSKAQIEDRLSRAGGEIESNAVEVYVSRLRRKLGRDLIRTIRGLGYMLGETP